MKFNTPYRVALLGTDYNVMIKETNEHIQVIINKDVFKAEVKDVNEHGLIKTFAGYAYLEECSGLPLRVLTALQRELENTILHKAVKPVVTKPKQLQLSKLVGTKYTTYTHGDDVVTITSERHMFKDSKVITVFLNAKKVYRHGFDEENTQLLTKCLADYGCNKWRSSATRNLVITTMRVLSAAGYKATDMEYKTFKESSRRGK
jgi:hypothetical protein